MVMIGVAAMLLGLTFFYFTGIERTVTEVANWRIDVDEHGLVEIDLSIKGTEQAETILSQRVLSHLENTQNGSVDVTFWTVSDFGIRHGRGPILTVDGIAVDD
jgi:hypothetical protein